MIERTVDLDGPVHHVELEGPADGPTFLLLHGLGASWLNWTPLAQRLRARGRVLAMDLIGFGRTPLEGRESTMEQNRALVSRFIESVIGGPVVLVGNSMGGLISTLQAASRPDQTAGLVLIDPASPNAGLNVDKTVAAMFATYMIPRAGERFVRGRAQRLGPDGLVHETIKMCCVDPTRVDAAVIEDMKAFSRERLETMDYWPTAFLQATRSMIGTLARRRSFMQKVRSVSCPTLLLQGRHDRLVSFAAAEAIARARPDWDFVVFEDLGHAPHLEDPDAVFGEIERWLTGPASRLLGGERRAEA